VRGRDARESFIVFTAGTPDYNVALLDADRQDPNQRGGRDRHVIEYTEVPDSQFPRRDRIGPERFSIPRLLEWLADELALDGVERCGPLPRRQGFEVCPDGFGKLNSVGRHERG
jgi:hypothetical protein